MQRFADREEAGKILAGGELRDRRRRDEKVVEAVAGHRYTQGEVANFLGLHFTSVSRIMNKEAKCKENRPDPKMTP